MFIANLFENKDFGGYLTEDSSQLVVLYPGRFQPFHLGHKEVFNALQNRFGRDQVYISTSNKTELPKSPFDFNDKTQLMHAAGIPADRIVESSNPYKIPPQFDPSKIIFVVVVGEPDKDRLKPDSYKKDGNPTYYKSFTKLTDCESADKHGYVIIAAERHKVITISGQEVDVSHGTTARELWNVCRKNPSKRAEYLTQMFGRDDFELGRIMDKVPQEESISEDIPPPENARKTQIAGTLGTYKKASDIFKQHGVSGKALDFGAGLGKGTPELGDDAESYEPFPNKDFNPNFIDATKIPDNSYKRLVNLNVLNVVPNIDGHRIRDEIVRNIGRVLAPGGVALITTRGRDVLTIKGTPGEEPMSMVSSIGTYQKGFTSKELREYVASVLGDGYTVNTIKLGPAGVMIKKAESLSEGLMDNPKFVAWFSGSKVVDKQGNPLRVYHGTFADIHSFKSRGVARQFGNAQRLLGYFFTPDAAYASQYADKGSWGQDGGNVVPVYLSIKNPKVEPIDTINAIEDGWSDRRTRNWRNKLIEAGHDGILFTNGRGMDEWVAFTNRQMKSAVGNKGTYDSENAKLVAEEAAGVGVVKNGNDPRYSMATMGDQNDVDASTLGKEMDAFMLTGRKLPSKKRAMKEHLFQKYTALQEEMNAVKKQIKARKKT